MKPCSKNRELIAWLVMDALDAEPARQLREHLDTCAGCRQYRDEIATVKEKLARVEIAPELQASAAFHRRWTGAINSKPSGSVWDTIVAQFRGYRLSWRVALPALAAIVLVVLAMFTLTPRRETPSPVQASARTVSQPKLKAELPPTFANYEMAANRSLEAFDELLTREGNRNLPPVPVYTASTLAAANWVE